MHEIGNALGLPDDNDSPNLMHHKDFNDIITETMYSRLEERGYSVDRNAVVNWEGSNNSGGNNSGGGNPGGGNPGSGSSGNYYPNLASLTSDQWDEYSGDNTRFDYGWPDYRDDSYLTPEQFRQPMKDLYTELSKAVVGDRYRMTAGYLHDPGYHAGITNDQGLNVYHAGIDIDAPDWTDVKVLVGGETTLIYNQAGNYIMGVKADDGNLWLYTHLGDLKVTAGKRIEAGDVIGRVGSMASHLHLEVQKGHTYQPTWRQGDRFDFVKQATISPLQAFWEWKNKQNTSASNNGSSGSNSGALLGGSITIEDPNGKPSPYYATDLGTLNGRFIRSGDIGNTYDYGKDEKDYYSFKVDKDNTRVNLSLERLSGQIWDAGLELRDENGSLLYTSIYDIGRTLNKGTYYVGVSSIGSAKTDYKLRLVKLSGDIENRGLSDFDIDGGYTARHPDGVQLYRYNKDGRTTYNNIDDDSIEPNKDTVVVIHGWQDSDEGGEIQALLRTVAITHPSYQVLALNWHDPASDPRDSLFPFHSARSIQPVAQWAADTLEALGIKPNQISLLGHSLGSYVSAEIGRIFNEDKREGKVKNLVAFDPANAFDLSDPANVGGRIYDIDGNKLNKQRVTDFNQVATKSLAFVAADWAFPVTTPLSFTSIAGDNDRAGTAHDSFVIRYYRGLTPMESYDPGRFHKGTIDVFTDALSKGFLSFPNLSLPSHRENWYDNAGDQDNPIDILSLNYGKHEGRISVNLNSGDTWDWNGKNPWRIKELEYVKDSFGNTAKAWN